MNNITDLRQRLFYQLHKLATAKPGVELDLELKRSQGVVQVAEMIVKTVQAETQFIAVAKGIGTGFICSEDEKEDPPPPPTPMSVTENSSELFNVDKEKNWLIDAGNPDGSNQAVSTARIGKSQTSTPF